MKRQLLSGILSGFLVFLSTPGVSDVRKDDSTSPTPKKLKQRVAKPATGTEVNPLFVQIVGDGFTQPAVHEQKTYFDSEWWLVYLTGLLVLATAGLMLYTARLWKATIDLGKDAKATSERQSSEMQRSLQLSEASALAANRSAEIAERALIAGDRAFVSVLMSQSANLDAHTGNVVGYTFTPVWVNAGNTPTRGMRNYISIYWIDRPIEPNWDFPDLAASDSQTESVPLSASPRGQVHGNSCYVPINIIESVITGGRHLYLWGWAKYRDVFPNTPLHVTRFAVQIRVGGNASDPQRISFQYSYLPTYNCADEECAEQDCPAERAQRRMII